MKDDFYGKAYDRVISKATWRTYYHHVDVVYKHSVNKILSGRANNIRLNPTQIKKQVQYNHEEQAKPKPIKLNRRNRRRMAAQKRKKKNANKNKRKRS